MIKEIKVDGREYKLQRLPVRDALKLRQDTGGTGIEFYEGMLEHIVVEPKMDFEDFDSLDIANPTAHLDNLMREAASFQYEGK